MKKKRDPRLKDFELIPNTSGVILNGIYLKNDNSELIIKLAWGGDLHFKPLTEEDNKHLCGKT